MAASLITWLLGSLSHFCSTQIAGGTVCPIFSPLQFCLGFREIKAFVSDSDFFCDPKALLFTQNTEDRSGTQGEG